MRKLSEGLGYGINYRTLSYVLYGQEDHHDRTTGIRLDAHPSGQMHVNTGQPRTGFHDIS